MKKKLILMGIAGVLVTTTMIGGTLAAFQANSLQGTSHITTKDLSIYISDKSTGQTAKDLDYYSSGAVKVMPGAVIDEDLTVAFSPNSDHYDSYVRVTVYKAWGEKAADGNFSKTYDQKLDLKEIAIRPENENDWIIRENDDETITMYYKKQLSDSSETTKFIDEIALSKNLDNGYTDKSFVIEASADAVQAIGGTDAIKSAWGVTVTLDGAGNIETVAD